MGTPLGCPTFEKIGGSGFIAGAMVDLWIGSGMRNFVHTESASSSPSR